MATTKPGAAKARRSKAASAAKPVATEAPSSHRGDGVIKVIFASAGYELLEMDPHKLYLGEGIESNTRNDIDRDEDFFRSVARNGVDLVIEARRDEQNRVKVHDGKMRTLAAREGGVKSVLVLVKPTDISDERTAEVERIFSQLRINELRSDISHKDKILALRQLVLLDVTAGELAEERNIELREAEKIVATVRSKAAVQAAEYDLTIDEMAIFAEFDGDEDALEVLTTTAQNQRGNLNYIARELRSKRADVALVQQARTKLAGSTVTALTEQDDAFDDDKAMLLEKLRPSAGHEPGSQLTTAAHKKCPGHAVLISLEGFGKHRKAVAEPVCTDYRLYGHARRDAPIGVVEPPTSEGKKTPQQLADSNAARANNPKWRDATAPRIEWTSEFLLAGVLPSGFKYHRRLAQLQAAASYEFKRACERGHRTLCQTLRIPLKPTVYGKLGGDIKALQKLCAGASEQRAKMINLGMWLFAVEENLGQDAWRSKSPEAVLLMTVLEELGKPMQEIELMVLGRDQTTITTGPEVPSTGQTSAGQTSAGHTSAAPEPATTLEPASTSELAAAPQLAAVSGMATSGESARDEAGRQDAADVDQISIFDDPVASVDAVTSLPAEAPMATPVTDATEDGDPVSG